MGDAESQSSRAGVHFPVAIDAMTVSTQSRTLTIPAGDGFPLSASCFGPDRANTVLLVAPATGVRRRLYRRMAEYLGERGLAVITFDYRGTGESRPDSLRGFEASMVDWAVKDLDGVITWSADRFPDAGRVVLGHSYGGCAVGLAPNAGLLDAVVAIAAPNAYWGHWPFPERYGYAALWYAGMPVLSHLYGYFPGRALGLGEDLPRGVALQWARWSRRPEYAGDAGAHGDISLPILALSFSDDAFAPRSSVDALMAEYKRADIDRRHLTPKDIGASRIGHFGCFRAAAATSIWDDIATWVRLQASRT